MEKMSTITTTRITGKSDCQNIKIFRLFMLLICAGIFRIIES